MNVGIVEFKVWIDLAFSLHVSNTWAIVPIISSNFVLMFVTQEDNVALPPYNFYFKKVSLFPPTQFQKNE